MLFRQLFDQESKARADVSVFLSQSPGPNYSGQDAKKWDHFWEQVGWRSGVNFMGLT